MLTDELHPQELIGTGLAPSDFELLNCKAGLWFIEEMGYHPDDEWKEYEHKMPNEE